MVEGGPEAGGVKLDKLIAAGVKTARGAAQVKRREREAASGEPVARRLSPKKIAAVETAIRAVRWTGANHGIASALLAGLEIASGRAPDGIPLLLRDAIEGVLKK